MKQTFLKIFTGLLLVTQAQAADLYLPNLGKSATGTTTGAKRGLDVYISGGSIGGAVDGSAWSAGATGSLSLGVRHDAEGALSGVADGDYTPFQVDSNGRLKVDAALIEAATAADGGALPALTKVTSGYDGTNVQVLKTDATGSLQVDVESSALPTGAATEANQISEINHLAEISGYSLDTSGFTAASATSLSAIDTKLGGTLTVDGSGATQPVSAAALPLPAGASTEAKQDTGNTSLGSIDGKLANDYGAASGALRTAAQVGNASGVADFGPGAGSSQSLRAVIAGSSVSDKARYDYTSGTVTTGAYTQLDASLAGDCNSIEIFDSSGETLLLATGAAASEVDLLYITPGGNGRIPVRIASGTRLSVKAVSASASAGELVLNCYN
jgi:hypothetical protein